MVVDTHYYSELAIGLLLLICSVSDVHITACQDTALVRCASVYEDPTTWHWWYNWHNNTMNLSDPPFINGTNCGYHCPANCTCSLGKNAVIINCIDESISTRTFHYPPQVRYLSWAHSTLHTFDPDAFRDIGGTLETLHLNNISLESLPPGVFAGLVEMWMLDLSHNLLVEIHSDVFEGLSKLERIDLSHNKLQQIQPSVFQGLTRLRLLLLNNNGLQEIKPDTFKGLILLEMLNLNSNMLQEIQPGVFQGLTRLEQLDLESNMLQEIQPGAFQGLTRLEQLDLESNMLQQIQPGAFQGLTRLLQLDLDTNLLQQIPLGAFQGLTKLKGIYLRRNKLDNIPPALFGDMGNLYVLVLPYNQLTFLHSETFRNQSRLDILNLSHNRIQSLSSGLFQNLLHLHFLDLSHNLLNQISVSPFQNCLLLETLNMSQNPLLFIEKAVFNGLNVSTNVYVEHYATCCFVRSAKCIHSTSRSDYLTCERLLPYSVLRIGIWIVTLAILSGNVLVLFLRCRKPPQRNTNTIQHFLITNLSISDLFMGMYLMVLLSVDLYFKEYFPSHSNSWRESIWCRTVGALSVLSSEASVFFITLISIDRLLGIKYPFSSYRLGTKSARIVVSSLWVVAFGISLSSFILGRVNSDVYSVSEICVGLPISRKNMYEAQVTSVRLSSSFPKTRTATELALSGSRVGMYFSIAIFTALNLLCFSIVGICYLLIFISVRQSAKHSGRSRNSNEEIRMAKKMSLIVLTDFCCWVPIGVLSILVQSGVVWVNPVGYAWIATFVLPLNSSINPFLYTLASVRNRRHTVLVSTRYRSKHTDIQMKTMNA